MSGQTSTTTLNAKMPGHPLPRTGGFQAAAHRDDAQGARMTLAGRLGPAKIACDINQVGTLLDKARKVYKRKTLLGDINQVEQCCSGVVGIYVPTQTTHHIFIIFLSVSQC